VLGSSPLPGVEDAVRRAWTHWGGRDGTRSLETGAQLADMVRFELKRLSVFVERLPTLTCQNNHGAMGDVGCI